MPCIVDVATEELPYWQKVSTRHVVVVVGMDHEHIYLNDPEFANAPAAYRSVTSILRGCNGMNDMLSYVANGCFTLSS